MNRIPWLSEESYELQCKLSANKAITSLQSHKIYEIQNFEPSTLNNLPKSDIVTIYNTMKSRNCIFYPISPNALPLSYNDMITGTSRSVFYFVRRDKDEMQKI